MQLKLIGWFNEIACYLGYASVRSLGECVGHEREQVTVVVVVAMEAQLGQIVQEKIELSEPGAKRILNHASK